MLRPISAARRVKDYLPDPPTPTNKADDLGCLIIREIRIRWHIASSKSTKLIFFDEYLVL
jgi:hypothetical protein